VAGRAVRRSAGLNQPLQKEIRGFFVTKLSSAVLVVLLGTLLSVPAKAGSVSGKIRLAGVSGATNNQAAGEKENVVVWLEGAQDSKPPETPVRISQRNLQFAPEFVVAVKGQKIEMPNDDDVVHNVYSFTGQNQFNLGLYGKGEVKAVTLEQTGIVDVFCSIHHQMHARVFVVPTRYFASSLPGRSFTLSDVPPGKYVLKAWHQRSRMMEKTIVVPASGSITADITLEGGAQWATMAKR
jgi:plastocyanin